MKQTGNYFSLIFRLCGGRRYFRSPAGGHSRTFFFLLLLAAATCSLPGTVAAFPTWSADSGANTGNCADCHGDFQLPDYTSNHDGTAWGQSLMSGHQGFVNNNCQVCHADGDPNTAGFQFAPVSLNVGGDGGLGCVSCHGRTEDGPDQIGDGLRAHHMGAEAYLNWPGGIPGGLTCAQCHPSDVVQAGEDVPPPRYPSLQWDPCADAQFGPDGLDNDGDGMYDGNDSDCVICEPSSDVDTTCDGVDDDCDGQFDEDYVVDDTCGVGECQTSNMPSSCMDGVETPCEPGTPSEEVCDGLDNDCDGTPDNGIATTPTTCGMGQCAAAGVMECQGGSMVDTCVPGTPSDEVCDGLDNDCDGTPDNGIATTPTTCGMGECAAEGVMECQNGTMVDTCVPGTPSDEICDGLDNDCNGTVDDEPVCVDLCVDFTPEPTSCGVGECAATGETTCDPATGEIGDSCMPGTPSDEVCDGLDNDCDGTPDNGITATPTTCGVSECAAEGVLECQNGVPVDSCVPGTPSDEVCDGLDNDCDGTVDNGIATTPTTCGMGECAAEGVMECQNGTMVDTCVPGTPSDEVCDGLDNDCNGTVDDEPVCTDLCAGFTPEPTTCGVGECAATGMTTCDPATGETGDSCMPGTPVDELCNDLDDDCDDEVDEDFADKGMACTVGEGVCEATGVYVCKADGYGLECDAMPGEPGVEGPVDDPTCSDGMDNDCDGDTDLDDVDCRDVCDDVRAEVEAACPADAPWKNHGKYVSCAAKLVSRAVCDGRIDLKCAGEIVRDFARSDVGKKDKDDKSDDPSDDDDDGDDDHNGDKGDDDPSGDDDKGKSDKHKNKDKGKNNSKDDSSDDDSSDDDAKGKSAYDDCPADHIGDDDDHIVVADPIHVVGVVTNGGLVVLTDSPAFGSVHIVQPNEPGYPADLDLPDHAIVLEYTIENVPPGATAQVTVDFPSGVTDPALYKIVGGELRELDAEISPHDTLTFTVTDGGWLDEDNKANGRIVDPVVIGQAATVSTSTQAAAASSGGGGGGCALGMGATPVDMLSLAAPLLLLLRLKRRK